jgi:hypothetical protein
VLVDGVSKRAVCRNYGLGGWTLEKILTHPEPPGYRTAASRPKLKRREFLGVIDEIREADKTAPPKQRHIARCVFERLRDLTASSRSATSRRSAKSLEVRTLC